MWIFWVYGIVLVIMCLFLFIRQILNVRTWTDNLLGALLRLIIGAPLVLVGFTILKNYTRTKTNGDTSGVVIYGGIPIPVSFSGSTISFIITIIPLLLGAYLVFDGLWRFFASLHRRLKGKKAFM